MAIPVRAHAWRAVVVGCSIAWLGHVGVLHAETINSPDSTASVRPSSEPFGLTAFALSEGSLRDKWQALASRIDDDRVQLALCDGDREGCASPAALRFLAAVDVGREREGRARFGEINRAINLAIRPMSDLAQYGEMDVWTSPLVTFNRGAGDCEDYAIAKFVALRAAGVPAEDLRIVIMRDVVHGEDHAVAAARLDDRWLMLDNRRMAMIEDAYVRNYRPMFVIGSSGISRYAITPLLAGGPGRDAARSAALDASAQPGLIPSPDELLN
jgi:predicted transglutaminase-like cysteine proteinase